MSHQVTATLMRTVRQSIEQIKASAAFEPDDRALTRILAHLWSAYDELDVARRELLAKELRRDDAGVAA